MTWKNPVPEFKLVPTSDPESFRTMPWWPQMTTGVPHVDGVGLTGWQRGVGQHGNRVHPGAFAAVRKHDVHTGVDIYVPGYMMAFPVEDGVIVRHGIFTGPRASPPSPWWNETGYIMVEGESGVICYGEILPNWLADDDLRGEKLWADGGDVIGMVIPVLKADKGRPTSMLHIELYEKGYRGEPVDWALGAPQPAGLLDPTPFLLELCR